MNTELVILANLIHNESYANTVLPFLKDEYFSDLVERKVFEKIRTYIETYHDTPTLDVIRVGIQKDNSLSEELFEGCIELVDHLTPPDKANLEWLKTETEEFCRKRAIKLAILESVSILDGKSKDRMPDAIPLLLQDALGISFDTSIGHDYTEDAAERYDERATPESRVATHLDMLNQITRGGLPSKTLNVIMAGVGVGKTMLMCDLAANFFLQGKNVLYITLEMSDESIAERIDANLLGVNVDDLPAMDRSVFLKKLKYIKSKTSGKLLIQEYGTGSVNVNHFRALLKECQLKKSFVPDVVVLDYLNLCASAKHNNTEDKYGNVKAIAEEMRGLMFDIDALMLTATQINREGAASSDADMTNVAESWGVPQTADLFLLLLQSDDLADKNQVLVKQLKNRYRDKNKDTRFLLGVHKDQMRFYNLDPETQVNMTQPSANTAVQTDTVKAFFTTGKKFQKRALDLDVFGDES
jgi:replicative DNA helicase